MLLLLVAVYRYEKQIALGFGSALNEQEIVLGGVVNENKQHEMDCINALQRLSYSHAQELTTVISN